MTTDDKNGEADGDIFIDHNEDNENDNNRLKYDDDDNNEEDRDCMEVVYMLLTNATDDNDDNNDCGAVGRFAAVVVTDIEFKKIDFNACGVSAGNPGPSYLSGIHRCRATTNVSIHRCLFC